MSADESAELIAPGTGGSTGSEAHGSGAHRSGAHRSGTQKVETVLFPERRSFWNPLILSSLMRKESQRFVSEWHEMLLGPLVTTGLFLMIFEVAAGNRVQLADSIPLLTFVSAGLISITIVHGAYMFPAASLIMKRMDGSISDDLMSPVLAGEFVAGHCIPNIASALVTGLVVGLVCWATTPLGPFSPVFLLVHVVVGATMVSAISLIVGLWADKWDKFAAVEGFFLWPLTFLSGAFYSLAQLPEMFATVLPYTPFFMLVDGIRFGTTGYSEAAPLLGPWGGTAILAVLSAFLLVWGRVLVRRGYKLKA